MKCGQNTFVRPSVRLSVRPRVHQMFVSEFNCYEFYKLNWRIFYELSFSGWMKCGQNTSVRPSVRPSAF